MDAIETLLRTHPQAEARRVRDYAEVIKSLAHCVHACTSCADACLAEAGDLLNLRGCIRLNLDCAEVCLATARLLEREPSTPATLMHAQLHACVIACQLCAAECGRHAEHHEHCRLCADACVRCQRRCNYLLGELSGSGVEEAADPLESPGLSP